jgi:hypothetical protein
MKKYGKVDANQSAIVDALRSVGASVQSLSAVGNGVPDLLVGFRGQTHLFEVKDGSKPPSARKLTPDQQEWHRNWRGADVYVVTSIRDALTAIGITNYRERVIACTS